MDRKKTGNTSALTMNLVIMQPYFLPYLGYFQLMAAADTFVIYDDVAFIKQGWINRNRILLNGRAHRFVLPLQQASQNRLINEITLVDSEWPGKLLETLRHAYRRAPCFDEVFPLLEKIVRCTERALVAYLRHGLLALQAYLEIKAKIAPTSAAYNNEYLRGEARILDICRQEGATDYFNLSGGAELYHEPAFRSQGIALHLLETTAPVYKQFGGAFVPQLSIVDVLMFNPLATVQSWLSEGRRNT
jgi:GNAT superfamily N-acetyltransferase